MSNLLIDTDVLIDYLRGYRKAKDYLDNLKNQAYISSISVAELYAGVREKDEREILDKYLDLYKAIPIDSKIAVTGGLYRREYNRSHGVGLADAIIAATAESISASLVTLNKKHFPMCSKIIVPYQK